MTARRKQHHPCSEAQREGVPPLQLAAEEVQSNMPGKGTDGLGSGREDSSLPF